MCHFRGALVPGRYTCVENVCFVRPFGFEGRSCRRLVRGGAESGSSARRALQSFLVTGEKKVNKGVHTVLRLSGRALLGLLRVSPHKINSLPSFYFET
jgi:hypothetical protein